MSVPNLHDKIAVVTGASRGVGRGIALGLGEAGATVYLTGRSVAEGMSDMPGTIHQTARDVTEIGGIGIALQCDHRDDDQVKAVFDRVRAEHGRVDILVNNVWGGYEAMD
jgi:NAD(P)-dependent dehydrogenase (short-subunit alcohol dehydrogenase family)